MEMQNTINTDDENVSKYLLQYVLAAQGVCHENALLLALMRLKMDLGQLNKEWSISQWIYSLKQQIDIINVKLNPLSYKIVVINHGIGKNAVSIKNKQNFGQFSTDLADENIQNDEDTNEINQMILPESSKYYMYVNLQSTTETELATRFTNNEIEFIKWAIEQFIDQSEVIEKISNSANEVVVKEIDRTIIEATNGESTSDSLSRYITYTMGSTKLLQFPKLSAIEIEQVLAKLCDHKWFYRTNSGRFGMDLRCLGELEEYLVSTYEIPTCPVCNGIALQGITCGNLQVHFNDDDDDEDDDSKVKHIWHVDCFQHYITHVSKNCDSCQSSLITNGMYVI